MLESLNRSHSECQMLEYASLKTSLGKHTYQKSAYRNGTVYRTECSRFYTNSGAN